MVTKYPYVVHKNHIQLPCKERCAAVLRLPAITWVVFEEAAFRIQGDIDRFVIVDISLTTIDHRYVAQP